MKYLLEREETERLTFRLLSPKYFNSWVEFFRHPMAFEFLTMNKKSSPEEKCTEWFTRVEERYKNNLGGMNVLIDKITKEFIGQCGLLVQSVDGVKELEIGYSILPQFWNKGYASEAAIKCRNYAFENEFTDSLISIIHIDNIKSQKVAIKNGMIKTIRTEFKGMPVDIFRINNHDWLKQWQ